MVQNNIFAELKRANAMRPIGLLAIALVLMAGGRAASVAAADHTVDLASYAPNLERAATHELVLTDDSRLRFTLFGGGAWSRSLDDCGADYHLWTDAGLVYLGFTSGGCTATPQVAGMVPPVLVLPRRFDPETTWRHTASVVVTWATLDPATGTWRDPRPALRRVELTLAREELPGGERAIRLRYALDSGYEENWWVVDCIPVDSGGCDRGIRRMQLIASQADGGQVLKDVVFAQWVQRTVRGGLAPVLVAPGSISP